MACVTCKSSMCWLPGSFLCDPHARPFRSQAWRHRHWDWGLGSINHTHTPNWLQKGQRTQQCLHVHTALSVVDPALPACFCGERSCQLCTPQLVTLSGPGRAHSPAWHLCSPAEPWALLAHAGVLVIGMKHSGGVLLLLLNPNRGTSSCWHCLHVHYLLERSSAHTRQ